MIYRAFLLLLLVTTINLTSAVAATRDLILIKTTRLIDVRTGELRTDQAILIDGNKIAEVGPSSTVGQGGGNTVRVIDLTGLTVLPGLIDCHAHVLGNLKDLSASGPLRMSSPQGALWGVHNLQSCYEVPGAQIFAGALLHNLIQCQRCCPEVPAGALDPALAGPTRR